MRLNRWLGVLILLLSCVWSVRAQDLLPACPQVDKGTRACKPMREPGSLGDTVSVKIVFPVAFKGVGRNEVVDSLGILAPVLEHLRLVQTGVRKILCALFILVTVTFAGIFSSYYRCPSDRNIRSDLLYGYGGERSHLPDFYASRPYCSHCSPETRTINTFVWNERKP